LFPTTRLGTFWEHSWVCIADASIVPRLTIAKEDVVASLEKRGNRFRLIFRFAGRRYAHALRTSNPKTAEILRGGAEKTLMLLEQQVLRIPDGVSVADFIVSDGKAEPPRPAPVVLTLQQLRDRFKAHAAGTASGDQTLRRTYFFPTFKAGQTYVLYMNDRAWGEVGYTGGTDELLVQVRVLCDQGRQEPQMYSLLQPTDRGHLARGEVELVSAEKHRANLDVAGFFREIAAQRKSVQFAGKDGGKAERRFAEPSEPLRNMAGRVMVPASGVSP
jgi:hypothetical protein